MMTMIRKLVLTAAATVALSAGAAAAAEGESHIEDLAFSFEGPFGSFETDQLQRGLQVYTEVCSACHGLKFVPIRALADEAGPAIPEDQVRAYAAQLAPITDADTGEERDRLPTDLFPKSALPGAPDLSMMAKARAGFHGPYGLGLNQLLRGTGGPEYIVSILTGYTGEEKEEAGTLLYENTAFPGGWISMPPPLVDEAVTFADGAPNSVHAMSEDVAAFLMWTAEPKLTARKEVGFQAVLFLTVLAVLLYWTNKSIWAPVKRRAKGTQAE
jgi:ubiquinol-cytochrome c reductase cytochrome c1 subunit